MINEANEPSSACRLWRLCQVETSTPPKQRTHSRLSRAVGQACSLTPLILALTSAQRAAYKQAIAVLNLSFIRLAARERDSNAHCGAPAIHDEHEHKQSFCDCH